MSVYKVPMWMAEPCRNGRDCQEPGVHGYHVKWWARWLYRLGLVR